MEQVVQLPMSFLYKIGSLICLLVFGTAFMVTENVLSVLKRGPSMAILFANEYALTMVSLIGSAIRFTLNCIDTLNPEEPFEQRSTVIFYLDFFVDLFKLLIYTAFFAVVMAYYGLPIHIIRDLYVTVISFTKRVKDMVKYHQIMSTLQTRYPDVTADELATCNDPTCIICREEMTASVKRLPCGHFFHFKCLKSWLERQQVCPTCRKSVLEVVKPQPQPQPQSQQTQNQIQQESFYNGYPGNYRPNWSETNSITGSSQYSLNTANSAGSSQYSLNSAGASQNSLNTANSSISLNNSHSHSRIMLSPLRRSHSTSSLLPVLIDNEINNQELLISESERLKIAADLERLGRRSRSPLSESHDPLNLPPTQAQPNPLSPRSHVKSKIEYVEELMSEHEKILHTLRQVESEFVRERSFSRSRSLSFEHETEEEGEKRAPEA